MKLTTIVREGQDRAAVVLDLPVGWAGGVGAEAGSAAGPGAEGGSDPNPPAAGYGRYYLDVAAGAGCAGGESVAAAVAGGVDVCGDGGAGPRGGAGAGAAAAGGRAGGVGGAG